MVIFFYTFLIFNPVHVCLGVIILGTQQKLDIATELVKELSSMASFFLMLSKFIYIVRCCGISAYCFVYAILFLRTKKEERKNEKKTRQCRCCFVLFSLSISLSLPAPSSPKKNKIKTLIFQFINQSINLNNNQFVLHP